MKKYCPNLSHMRNSTNLTLIDRVQGRLEETEGVKLVDTNSEDEDDQTPLMCTDENGHEVLISLHRTDPSGSDTLSTQHSTNSWIDRESSTNPTSLSQGADGPKWSLGEGHPSMTFYRYSVEADDEPEDLESVISNDDDIQSQADLIVARSAIPRQTAVNYFIKTFSEDNELIDLYQVATRRISKDKFVRNHRRLLKKLFLDFDLDGMTPSQKLALRFLKSRRYRIHLSTDIYQAFVASDDSIRDKINFIVKKEKDSLLLLDRYLEGLDAAENPNVPDTIAGNGEIPTLH